MKIEGKLMKHDIIRLAMIGCGGIAEAHLKAITQTPSAQLTAVMDVVAEKAQAAAEKYEARVHLSVEDVLADNDVDAVILPLPHHLHCPVTVQAAEAGKHILVEKPMALNRIEAEQMVAAADRAGVKLMVGQSTRFRPEVWTAKKRIEQGQLGRIRQCIYQRAFFIENLSTGWRYSPEQCGGLYLPLFASHDVDMILWLMDAAPLTVHSVLRSFTELTEAESDGAITMEFEDDRIATLAFSLTSHIGRYHALFIGTQGTLLIDGHRLIVNEEEVDVDRSRGTFARQMSEFTEAIQMNREPIASGREVLPTMSVLDSAAEKAPTSAEVG